MSEPTLPTQVTPKRRKSTPIGSSIKIGLSKLSAAEKAKYLKNYLNKRDILRIPEEILARNPDKEFAFVNFNKLQESGMWHQNGWKVFRSDDDGTDKNVGKFTYFSSDDMIHRNEMVMVWMDKQEHQELEMGRILAEQARNHEDIITKNPNLQGFSPHAKHTKQEVQLNNT